MSEAFWSDLNERGKRRKFSGYMLHLKLLKEMKIILQILSKHSAEKKNHKSSDGKTCLHAAERFFHLLLFLF